MKIAIEKQIYGGSGLGRLDNGKVVLVPFTIDGEEIDIREIQEKSKTSEAIIEKILTASKHRIEPPCPYYSQCGGCQYQHIQYDHQLFIKKQILSSQLERLGGIPGTVVADTIPSKSEYGYRNHVQFHIDKDGRPGFQQSRSHDVILVQKCLLLEETLNRILETLMFEPESGIVRVAIRDDYIGTPVLYLSGETKNPPNFEIDFPLNVIYRGPVGEMLLSGESFNQFEILGKSFIVSAASFFQTNRFVAQRMIELLMERIPQINKTILDCYCGVGLFSAFLADRAEKLIGIESSLSACEDFAENLDRYDHVDLYQGNVEDVLPGLRISPDLVVLDPPRAGIAVPAIKTLTEMRPGTIAYISCDPSTLARDLKIFCSTGYKVDSVIPLDMFPQTYHIEALTILKL